MVSVWWLQERIFSKRLHNFPNFRNVAICYTMDMYLGVALIFINLSKCMDYGQKHVRWEQRDVFAIWNIPIENYKIWVYKILLQYELEHTVSAAMRFKPTPPALVDIKKTKAPCSLDSEFRFPEVETLKFLIAAKRSSARTEPSRRS